MAQENGVHFSDEIQFVQYLQSQDLNTAAYTALKKIKLESLNEFQKDSFNYFLGWHYYKLKSLEESSLHLSKVSMQSAYYHKASFFNSFCYAFSNNYENAEKVLNNQKNENEELINLNRFELATISLLKKDTSKYDSLIQSITQVHYCYANEIEKLNSIKHDLGNRKTKKPGIAALMSAIIPGTGKMYAGKVYEGVASLGITAVMAGATLDQYLRGGLSNPQFYIFGSIFSVFYIGNIYGSYFSVRIIQKEFEEKFKNTVLLHMHIPLRNYFN